MEDQLQQQPTATVDDAASLKPGPLRALLHNLRAGLGLALFLPARLSRFVISADQLLLLALLVVALQCGSDYLLFDEPIWFNAAALANAGAGLLLLLIGAYLAARLHGAPAVLLPLLLALLGVEPVFIAAAGLIARETVYEWAGPVAAYLPLGLFVWLLAVWLRVLYLVFPTGRWRTALSLPLLVAFAIAPLWWLPAQHFWYPDESEADAEFPAYAPFDVEATYYRQPALLQAALDALAPEQPGRVDLYHIGFGGYAGQAVFRREVLHVRDILDARLDTAERSLVLINSPETLDEVPLASRTNLGLALRGVARRMNPEEDVLLLYLTSHGAEDGTLAVEFWPLGLNALDARELRRLLDEAGIRWRVLVISACYSGQFVEALRDERTLIMTAAAADRQSFGCSNENEYTYFGEALFKEALAQTRSLPEAFARARQRIEAREQAEGEEPSRPMMAAGDAILERLRAWERQDPEVAPTAQMGSGTHQ